MTNEQTTAVNELEAVYQRITVQILTNSAKPGTPQWSSLQTLLARQSLVQAQINALIAEQFAAVPSTALSSAIAQLQTATTKLNALATTLADVDSVLGVINTVVQVGTSIIALAASA